MRGGRFGVVLLLFTLVGRPSAGQEPVFLWPNGAPGAAANTALERVRLSDQGDHIVSSVHRPSITPYLPAAPQATGTAVIVIPGGGHRELWMDHEGYRVGQWLAAHGIAAFVLKYRLAREPGSTYTVEGDELADVRRAIRLVRSRAATWHIAPGRVGLLGFSAGGELVALAGMRADRPAANPVDSVDRESATPAFLGLVYPALPDSLVLSKDTPPAFLLCGENDSPAIADGVARLYQAIRGAGGSAELHVLTGVGHGFGIRENNSRAVAIWPSLFFDWLEARGMLAERPATGELSPQMHDGFGATTSVPVYTVPEREHAARQTLGLATPLTLGEPVSVTPDAPWAWTGAHLSVWKPSFVLGTAGGGEVGINFWGIHNEGHVNVGFTAAAGSSYLLDCRVLTAGTVTYKIYDGAAETFRAQGPAAFADHHVMVQVGAVRIDGPVSVELWPTPVTEPLGFLGCDLSVVTSR